MRAWLIVLLLVLAALNVQAHGERRVEFPYHDREVPEYRNSGPYELVCKEDTPAAIAAIDLDEIDSMFTRSARDMVPSNASIDGPEMFQWRLRETLRWTECMATGHRHVQAAIDAVPAPGHRVLVMPGLYQEEPSVAARDQGECAALVEERILTYAQQVQCPHAHNTIAIFGDDVADEDKACTWERLCDLQIEGTGLIREHVIIDAAWNHLNAIRADRADGFYITGLTAQRTDFNSLYILQTDGFAIDDVLTRWNFEYGFLTFAVDHGLYVDCESYGNGDSGIYPGSAADNTERPSIEIARCNSHHNALGYSGTAGNAVWAHNNSFHHNAAGIATDSLFPDHPGLPQDHARFENNRIYSNNENYFDNWLPDGPCHKPLAERGIEEGVVCPVIPIPVGTGILIAGGNDNNIEGNWIYDNWRYGTMLFGVPAYFRGEDGGLDFFCLLSSQSDACVQPTPERLQNATETAKDTSHRNTFVANWMGLSPAGQDMPNGRDHWWDESGLGNCWADNVYIDDEPRREAGDQTPMYPECGNDPASNVDRPYHARLLTIVPCNDYSWPNNTHPDGCAWMDDPEEP